MILNLSTVKTENINKYFDDLTTYLAYETNSGVKVKFSLENENNFIITPSDEKNSFGLIYTTLNDDFGDGLIRFHSSCNKIFIKSHAENVIEENGVKITYDVEIQLYCNNRVKDGTFTVISSIFAKVIDDSDKKESLFFKNLFFEGEFELNGLDEVLNLYSMTRNFYIFNAPQFYPNCKEKYTYIIFKDDVLYISREKLNSLQSVIKRNPNTADLNYINYRQPKEVDGTKLESNGELRYYGIYN